LLRDDQILLITKAVRPLALATIFGLLSTAICAAEPPGKISTAVDRAFRPLLKAYDVPGIAVAVTAGDQQYFFNYGVAAKDKSSPVTKDTLFEIGSLSKTFTATLVAYAQTLGKISLDDHPGKYLPGLRHSAVDKATLLNLGTYTAGGLPLQFPDGVTNNAEMATNPVSLDQLLAGNADTMAMQSHPATQLSPPRAPSEPTLFNKTGATNGFGAYVAFVPEKRIGIVMLVNKSFPIPARIKATYAVLQQLSALK
jgi:CubicO group peptidase (beta-lactamase class C family)